MPNHSYSDQFDCPACGHRFYRTTPETWKDQLPAFLAFFSEMITPSETGRLIKAGHHLGMWKGHMTAYRRLAQIKIEGYLSQPGHGWWYLTDKGIAAGRQYRITHPEIPIVAGVNDPTSIPGPTTAARPDRLDRVRTPTEWQIFFLKEFAKLPEVSLFGFKAVVRWARKEGWLGRGGTTGIRVLIADGWLTWGGTDRNYLILTETARALISQEPVELPPNQLS